MPVLLVRDTHPRPPARIRAMLQAVHEAVAQTLAAPPGSVWVRYEPGSPEHYWEGATGVPEGRPVLVFAHLVEGRKENRIQALYGAVSAAIAGAFQIDPD